MKESTKKELLKYIGIVILLLGVVVIALPIALGKTTNAFLASGLFLIVAGIVAHIFCNKKI